MAAGKLHTVVCGHSFEHCKKIAAVSASTASDRKVNSPKRRGRSV